MELEQRQKENWDFAVKQNKKAREKGYFIESLCLSYAIIEVHLRALLERKGISERIIGQLDSLKKLADCAHCRGFIHEEVHKCLIEFNTTRRFGIHRFIEGKVTYKNIGDALCGVDWVIQEITKA